MGLKGATRGGRSVVPGWARGSEDGRSRLSAAFWRPLAGPFGRDSPLHGPILDGGIPLVEGRLGHSPALTLREAGGAGRGLGARGPRPECRGHRSAEHVVCLRATRARRDEPMARGVRGVGWPRANADEARVTFRRTRKPTKRL